MARPKGSSPPRGAGVPVRFNDLERRYIDTANEKRYRELLRVHGGAQASLAGFLRAGAFLLAQEVLGQSLEEFEAKEKRRSGEK